MRKLFYTSTLLFSTLSTAFCQSIKKDFFSLGVVGGILASNAKVIDNNEQLVSTNVKSGFKIGMIGKAKISSHFYVEPEINFIRKGGKFDTRYLGNLYSNDMMMSFIEIPLNMTYYFSKDGRGLFLGTGYTFGLGLTGKLSSSTGNTTKNYDIDFWNFNYYSNSNNDKLYFKQLEHSITLLAGYSIDNKLSIKASFNQGFTSLLQSDFAFSNPSKTNYFGLTLSYLFFDVDM